MAKTEFNKRFENNDDHHVDSWISLTVDRTMLRIVPTGLYTLNELAPIIGKRSVERLRQHGLVALAGRYLGQNIIDAWLRAAQAEWQCRRGLVKGEKNEETTQTSRMEEGHAHRGVQRLPKPKPGTSLQDQLERSRRTTA